MSRKTIFFYSILFIFFIFFSDIVICSDFSKQQRVQIISKGYIHVDGNSGIATVKASASGQVFVFPLPDMPLIGHPSYPDLSFFSCKRVDVKIIPYGNDPSIHEGGETLYKGGCDPGLNIKAGGNGTYRSTPSPKTIPVRIILTKTTLDRAKNACKSLNPQGNETKFYRMTFKALLKIKYCFLDMRGKVINGKRVWNTNCGSRQDTKEIVQTFIVPVSLECAKK